jgi:hypothetical protein
VRQIAANGTVKVFVTQPDVVQPSGVAYDPSHKRLFVADPGDPNHPTVRIFPVN